MKTPAVLVYGTLIFIQLLFGINFATSKILVQKLDPIIWSNLRFVAAGIGMLLITLIARRKHPPLSREFLLPLVPLSLLGMALGQGLFLFGLKYTTSINSAILTTSIPILALVIVILRRQDKLTVPKAVGFLLSCIGVVFIRDFSEFKLSSQTLIGDGLVLGGALCFALYLSYGRNFLMKFDNMWVTTWMFLISGVTMCLVNLPKWSEFVMPELTPVLIGSAAYTIVGATLLTYLLNNWVLSRAPTSNVAVFIYLQPVAAAFVGWKFLGEQLNIRMLFCTFLILLGLVCSMLKVAVPQKSDG